jgi:hypothetical protein
MPAADDLARICEDIQAQSQACEPLDWVLFAVAADAAEEAGDAALARGLRACHRLRRRPLEEGGDWVWNLGNPTDGYYAQAASQLGSELHRRLDGGELKRLTEHYPTWQAAVEALGRACDAGD